MDSQGNIFIFDIFWESDDLPKIGRNNVWTKVWLTKYGSNECFVVDEFVQLVWIDIFDPVRKLKGIFVG